MEKFDLNRFVEAQNASYGSYEVALNEIRGGRKTSHWIWYIFPQLKGLGYSFNSSFYGIEGRAEAEEYMRHPLLSQRLLSITKALLQIEGKSAVEILGPIDAQKVKSCMTLFDVVSPNEVFKEVLDKYYNGEKDIRTLRKLE